ncbi:MAG TPA: tetratricopeptide repeat protein [Candidatus Elarobacter sp.]|jgi:tetratricopeptide (TPR) repeat protein|nr:tetratricopeptide repeat protein [Candidatus Elarobacter sp.]
MLLAVQKFPDDASAWYDLGLAHKYLGNWRECADANQRALEISSQPEDPAWWNLGIAATALRDWDLARRAWRGYGMSADEIPDGKGAIEVDWGLSPVRLHSETAEVVWGRRIDPARIRIDSIPFPESGHRRGDIVLHDGAPNGEREADGRVYSVFDALERWSPSEIPTLRAEVRCASEKDSMALIDAFEAARFAAEDWTANVRPLCKSCSEGRPDPSHHHGARETPEERSFGIAAPMGLAVRTLRAWREASLATRAFEEPTAVG